MAQCNITQLTQLSDQLAAAVRELDNERITICPGESLAQAGMPLAQSSVQVEDSAAVQRILRCCNEIDRALASPRSFLQRLTVETQVLASVQWLCDFVVLSCIPLYDSVPLADAATICVVPEAQLRRVVRMTSTVGFLCEPSPGRIGHTPLSAQFVTDPSLIDAVNFLGKVIAPTALQMTQASRQFGHSVRSDQCAYSLLNGGGHGIFSSDIQRQPKLYRQAKAHIHDIMRDDVQEDEIVKVVSSFDWAALSDVFVLHVKGQSNMQPPPSENDPKHTALAVALASAHPRLRIHVQLLCESFATPSVFTAGVDDFDVTDWLALPSVQTNSESATPGTYPRINGNDSSNGQSHTPFRPAFPPTAIPPHLADRVTVEFRMPDSVPSVWRANIYLIQMPLKSPLGATESLLDQMTQELEAHFAKLRASPASRILLLMRVPGLPEPVDPLVGALAAQQDLILQQLSQAQQSGVAEVQALLARHSDARGKLNVVNQLQVRDSSYVALEIAYLATG